MPDQMLKGKLCRALLGLILLPGLAGAGLVGCVRPDRYVALPVEEEPPPPPPTQVYFYPTQEQSQARQERDSYECYLWAKRQSGFDPSAPNLAPHTRLEVVPEPPPGVGAAMGAMTGAILGAAVASHGNRPEGAIVGALAGGLLGSASDVNRQEQAALLQEQYDRQSDRRQAISERQAADYRRALTACLEGRGYTVR